jgi:phage terminase large subunit GpA-like protein
VNWRGNRIKRGVKLWMIGTDSAKAEIYSRLRTSQPGPGYVHLSRELPGEVFDQLTAERLVTKYIKGRARLEWMKPNGKRNEALDCAVYALAAAHYIGIDRWRDGDWAKWESRVQTRDLFDVPPPAAPSGAAAPAPAPAAPAPAAPLPVGPAPGAGGRVALDSLARFNGGRR